jgi:hypothetical protein
MKQSMTWIVQEDLLSNLRGIVDTILVPHSSYMEGMRQMGQCLEYVKAGSSEPVCVALIGESRTGKSRTLESFQIQHPAIRFDDGLHVPLLSITVPSRPTVKSLAELLLKKLGATDWEKGTENVKTARLEKLMKECRVYMLILDEFHHFFDKTSRKVQHHVADWLKNLVGACKVALIVSGLPSLTAVIDQNEQLAGRFKSPVLMPRFDWNLEDHRSEWIGILGAFSVGLREKFDLPELDGDNLALRMYCATGGLIGYLTKTLRQAIWNAIDTDSKVITLKDIQVGHQQAVWSHERHAEVANPFDPSVLVDPCDTVLAAARRIGTPVVIDPDKPTRQGAVGSRSEARNAFTGRRII